MLHSSQKMVIYQLMTRLFGNKTSTNKSYGTIEENGVGKFNDITTTALRGILELGTTHVWYTGIIEHATLTRYTSFGIAPDDPQVVKGRAGSPYAIKDYYDVDPDLAVSVPDRMQEFEELVQRTHECQLKVIIDFIPNHVARAYRSDAKPANVKDLGEDDDVTSSFHPNNNFYYLPGESFKAPDIHRPTDALLHPAWEEKFQEIPAKATGNDAFVAAPDIHSWFETVKLNYGVDIRQNRMTHFHPIPDTWFKMRDILLFWAGKKIDGFRCDMAEMVPAEFWSWVIPQVKGQYPDVIFIAEIYNPSRYRNYIEHGQFDYLYDKVMLYDTLRLLLGGKRSTVEIHKVQQEMEGIDHHMLHFMENHDEQRIASRFFAGNAWHGLPAMVISATIDRGPIMIYFGQEVGEPAEGAEGFNGDDGRTTIFDYWGVPEHQKWMNGGKFDGALLLPGQKKLRRCYAALLAIASQSKAVSSGKYADITAYNIEAGLFPDRIHAFVRYHETERLLIVNSFSDKELFVKVRLPEKVITDMNLNPRNRYIARDVLWQQVEAVCDHHHTFELILKPFGSFIFTIKQSQWN